MQIFWGKESYSFGLMCRKSLLQSLNFVILGLNKGLLIHLVFVCMLDAISAQTTSRFLYRIGTC
jgi:hypothetical protein